MEKQARRTYEGGTLWGKGHSGGRTKALTGECFRRFKGEPRGQCGQGRVGTRKKAGGGGQQSSHPEDHKGRGEGLAFTLRETGL